MDCFSSRYAWYYCKLCFLLQYHLANRSKVSCTMHCFINSLCGSGRTVGYFWIQIWNMQKTWGLRGITLFSCRKSTSTSICYSLTLHRKLKVSTRCFKLLFFFEQLFEQNNKAAKKTIRLDVHWKYLTFKYLHKSTR